MCGYEIYILFAIPNLSCQIEIEYNPVLFLFGTTKMFNMSISQLQFYLQRRLAPGFGKVLALFCYCLRLMLHR